MFAGRDFGLMTGRFGYGLVAGFVLQVKGMGSGGKPF